jgi:hypothetical protein
MKRVLVITYYWPPAGGSGVQRVAKFCKYLPRFGWEPVVLTVREGTYASVDPSLEKDVCHIRKVHKARSVELHRITGRAGDGKSNANLLSPKGTLLRHFLELARLNLLIPDARIGWYPDAVQMGERACKTDRIDLIFSTCPPFTTHLVAKRIRNKCRLPWVADFRDPWLEQACYNTVFRNVITFELNKRLELSVLKTADVVVAVGEKLRDLLASKVSRPRIETITNGYDEADFPGCKNRSSMFFYLSYYGTLHGTQTPEPLFKALSTLSSTHSAFNRDFRIRFVGNISSETLRMVNTMFGRDHWAWIKYLEHEEMISTLQEEQVLVLLVNRVRYNRLIITGKIFEYLRTGNPVLGVGPDDSEASDILKETGAGRMFDYADTNGIKDFILSQYARWKEAKLRGANRHFPKYERASQTAMLADLFDRLA